MEKQQVSTFLKILQIPTDAPADEIKTSLLDSGWNEADADEAVSILHPDHSPKGSTTPSTSSPQLVAQKYVRRTTDEDSTESKVADTSEVSENITFSPDSPDSASKTDAKTVDTDLVSKPSPAVAPLQKTVTHEPVPEPKAVKADKPSPADDKDRPHTDAPWLTDTVDIYDVSEEEKQRMIRTVYRTNERLTPQTIHALLGIDVDLSEYEAAYKKEVRESFGWTQIAIIFATSLVIASVGIYLGLYYFEVGPFHPTITGGR